MYKFIFELITEPLGLPIEWYKEWLLLWAINEIAFKVAFDRVGGLYRGGMSGKSAGSFFHWLIRTIVFVAMWAVTYGVIKIVEFVITYKQYFIISIIGIAVVVLGKKLWIWLRERNKLVKCVVRAENSEK